MSPNIVYFLSTSTLIVSKSPSLLADKVSLGVVAGSTQLITKIITVHSTSSVPLNSMILYINMQNLRNVLSLLASKNASNEQTNRNQQECCTVQYFT